MGRKRPIIAIDLDGTLVENEWPGIGAWKPGAIQAIRAFQRAGCLVMVFTIRISPFFFDGTERPPDAVQADLDALREFLDSSGLPTVVIWNKPGKPPYTVLIDDKAERFNPSKRAWQRMTEKVLLRLGQEELLYEDGEWGWEDSG